MSQPGRSLGARGESMQQMTTWMTGINGHKAIDARPHEGVGAPSASTFGGELRVQMTCGTNDTVRPTGPDEGSTG